MLPAVFSMQIRISGGSSDTELNADTVMPKRFPAASFVVTTVTPLANRESVCRKSSELIVITKNAFSKAFKVIYNLETRLSNRANVPRLELGRRSELRLQA